MALFMTVTIFLQVNASQKITQQIKNKKEQDAG